MKIHIGLVIAAAVAWSISGATAFAKTRKSARRNGAPTSGMQARGVTEKAYVEQCKGGGAEPTAAAPAVKPAETASPAAPGNRRPLARKPQRLYRRVASGQGRNASPWRHRKGLC